MKAVILPTSETKNLGPLTSWLPEFLLPVVNKPIVEHLIELLVRHDVKEIFMILKHMPYETEEYFGDGSRWGVRLFYSLLNTYRGIADALEHLEGSKLEGPVLCLPADVVTDLDISAFFTAHRESSALISQAMIPDGGIPAGLHPLTVKDLFSLEGTPLIASREGFMLIPKKDATDIPDGMSGIHLPPETPMVKVTELSGTLMRIRSPADLVQANRRVLEGEFPGILIPGKLEEPGVRVGRHCSIQPGVRLEPPLLIGDHCSIQKGGFIGSGTVIGNQVIIDQGAAIRNSLVLDRTYVGAHTEIRDAVVRKNWMLQIPTMLSVHLSDDLILGDLAKKSLTSRGERLVDGALAAILLILTSPLMALLWAYHLLFPSKKFLSSEKRFGAKGRADLEGKIIPEPFDLFFFRSGNRLLRKLPGLVSVIRGDLSMVGLSPLDEADLSRLPEDWRQMRANAPVGLFHLWEIESRDDLEWEEKMVSENYYAVSRSFWGDLKVLAKAIRASAFR